MNDVFDTDITFDEGKHEYRVNKIVFPSVSNIVSEAGFKQDFSNIPERIITNAGNRGKAIHAICEYDDLAILDENSVEYPVELEAWRDWKNSRKMEIVEVERMIYHGVLGYCGRIDRIININGNLYVVDIKTGSKLHWSSALQLALYAMGYGYMMEIDPQKIHRLIVKIIKGGGYEEIDCDDVIERSHADEVARCCAIMYKFKQERGMI